MRVEVIGGGPGGMYTARLLKLRHPDWEVRVHERNEPDATFGFGIGLSPVTLARMKVADRETFDGLMDLGNSLYTWTMRIGERSITGGNNQSVGLERAGLLRVLGRAAESAGVDVDWGRITTLDDVADADLVIAAEGAGSPTRTTLAEHLGVTVESGDLGYIWCGADIANDTMLFEVVEDDFGVYVAHIMAYDDGHSTFQIDTRYSTVRASGMHDAPTDDDGNNRFSLDRLSGLYAKTLGGAELRGNRSTWNTFNTVRCQRWSHENVVLIGDAAHTAHYSVGSGTRMAMEDALSLATALGGASDLRTSLATYEEQRRRSADRLQDRAVRSQEWWHAFDDRMHLPLPLLMTSYMTRTGALGATALAKADDDLVMASLAELDTTAMVNAGDEALLRILATPLKLGRVLPSRVLGDAVVPGVVATNLVGLDVVGEGGVPLGDTTAIDVAADADAVAAARAAHPNHIVVASFSVDEVASVASALALMSAGADIVRLRVPAGHEAVLATLDLAELIRLAGGTVAVLGTSDDLDMLCAGVISGRLDLISIGAEVAA